MPVPYKMYLGNSVYAEIKGNELYLTTDNGNGASNTIILDGETYALLVEYVAAIKRRNAKETEVE